MGRKSISGIDNPYLEEGGGENSAELIMEEARQRWRTGSWRPREGAFDIDRRSIAGEAGAEDKTEEHPPEADKPEASPAPRFSLDIKHDLMGEAISLRSLRGLDYSASYRPTGNLDEINVHKVTPMSTRVRYDVLAGDLEAPPEDLSFLTDAQRRYEREVSEGRQRDGRLRRDSRRLDSTVDERRSQIIRMLPEQETDKADRIITETNRRRMAIEAELGILPKEEDDKKPKRKGKRVQYNLADPAEAIQARYEGARLSRLPEQAGMEEESTAALPEFETETRRWRNIMAQNPTWSEVAEHTEASIPQDQEERERPEEREAHYAPGERYDRRARFADTGTGPRERVRATEGVGEFRNEYIAPRQAERIREIMAKKYRGRWLPPEFLADDRLVNEWFNQFSRGAVNGEDFATWAMRQREMAAQQRTQPAARVVRPRPYSPSEARRAGRPDARRERERYYSRSEAERCEEARRMGYRDGRDIHDERERERDRDRERDRARDRRSSHYIGDYDHYDMRGRYNEPYDPYMDGYDPYMDGCDPYMDGYDPYMDGYDPYADGYDPYAYGYDPYYEAGYAQGAQFGDGGYQGMYPDLFEDDGDDGFPEPVPPYPTGGNGGW